jgi:hypothetical protein
VFDLAAGRIATEAAVHRDAITMLEAHPLLPTALATGSRDHTVRHWSLEGGSLKCVATSPNVSTPVRGGRWIPPAAGSALATVTSDNVRVWSFPPAAAGSSAAAIPPFKTETLDLSDVPWGAVACTWVGENLRAASTAASAAPAGGGAGGAAAPPTPLSLVAASIAGSFVSVWSVNLSMLAPLAPRPLHAFSVLAGRAPAAAAPAPAPSAAGASTGGAGAGGGTSDPAPRSDSPVKSARGAARLAAAPAPAPAAAVRSTTPPPRPTFQLPRTPPKDAPGDSEAAGGGDVLAFMAAMGPDAGRDAWLTAVAASAGSGGGAGDEASDGLLSPGVRQVPSARVAPAASARGGGDSKLADTAEVAVGGGGLSHTDRKTIDEMGDGASDNPLSPGVVSPARLGAATDGKEYSDDSAWDAASPAPTGSPAEPRSSHTTPPPPPAAVLPASAPTLAPATTAPPAGVDKAAAILDAVARAQEAAAIATAAMAAAKGVGGPAPAPTPTPAPVPSPVPAPQPPAPIRRQPSPPVATASAPTAAPAGGLPVPSKPPTAAGSAPAVNPPRPVAPAPAPASASAAPQPAGAVPRASGAGAARLALAAGELIPSSRSEPLGLDLASFLPANNARGFGASRVLPAALASTFTQSGKQLAALDGAARAMAAGHGAAVRTLTFRLQEVRAAADLWGAGNVTGCLAVLLTALESDTTVPVAFVRSFRLDSGALNLDSAAVMWRLAAAMFAAGTDECVDAACGAFADVLRSFGSFSSTTLAGVPVSAWREAVPVPATGGLAAAFPPGASGLDLSVEERVNRSLALLTAGEVCRMALRTIATGPRGGGNVVLATEALAAYEAWRGGVAPAALASVASITAARSA